MIRDLPQASEAPVSEGMAWSWDLDLDVVLGTVGAFTGATADPVADELDLGEDDRIEADFADYLEAREAGRTEVIPLPVVTGRVAESLPTGPGLAGWLAVSRPGDLDDWSLPGAAASYRRLASWAQAGELAAVARLASRSAAADDQAGSAEDGRPAKVTADACGQVSLALTMSQSAASWWTDLAVTLEWRLAATGAALRRGDIDLARARAIADATSVLNEEKAREVEAKVLPRAGLQTLGQLRSALRRAVIVADPEGAEQRRQEAERRARVTLYPDEEGTASLAGYNLPGICAAAAMARITALARAMKAAGDGGGIDLLRSKVFVGLLLGTLPHIPPPPAGPADADLPPDNGAPDDGPPDADIPSGVSTAWDNLPPGDAPEDPGDAPDYLPEAPESAPEDPSDASDGARSDAWDGVASDDDDDVIWVQPAAWPQATAFFPPAPGAMADLPPTEGGLLDLRVPWSALAEGSGEPGYLARLGPVTPSQARYLARLAACDPAVQWRVAVIGSDDRAFAVTRVPVTTARSRSARAGPAGRPPGQSAAKAAEPASHGTLVGRVTVTISRDALDAVGLSPGDRGECDHVPGDLSTVPGGMVPGGEVAEDGGPGDHGLGLVLERILAAAAEAAGQADARAAADATAPGGCAHVGAKPAYRPAAWIREYVTARDVTCRYPTCRQPAIRCDLDHTKPHDQGGPSCCCNTGPLCRHHHKLKQLAGWLLSQPAPGTFIWTTPSGRAYTIQPDLQAA